MIIPDTNDFRTRELLRIIMERKKYEQIYNGEIGEFFDSLILNPNLKSLSTKTAISEYLSGGMVYPRSQNFLMKHDSDWASTMPHFANYGRIICEIYSDFVIGEGFTVAFENEEDQELWEAFKERNDFDTLAVSVLHQVIYGGYSGSRIYTEAERPRLEQLNYYNYFPDKHFTRGYEEDGVHLLYILEADWKNSKRELAYVIRYDDNDGNPVGEHAIYPYHKFNKFTGEEAGAFEELIWDAGGNINVDGTETVLTTEIPIQMIQSPLRGGERGLGKSQFKDIASQIQDLGLLTTIASNELHRHFKSKIAAPESAFGVREDGKADVKHPDYFIMEMNSQIPQYIQKDVGFFNPLFEQRYNLYKEISADTHIPIDFFFKKTTGNEDKVGVSKLLTKPFAQRITQLQTRMERWTEKIILQYFQTIGRNEPPSYRIDFPNVMEQDRDEVVQEMNDQLDREVSSKKRYLMKVERMTEEEAEAELDQIEAESKRFNGGSDAFAGLLDGTGE